MLLTVRVRPGASRTAVGGVWGAPGPHQGGHSGNDDVEEGGPGSGGQNGPLVVAVGARAVDGAANAAVVAAVAQAFGLRTRQVTLRNGSRSRTKILDLDIDPERGQERLRELLGAR